MNLQLSTGTHKSLIEGACIMEFVSYLANEPWSDHPKCVCSTLTAYAIKLNDNGPQWVRDALYNRAVKFINTRGSVNLQKRRIKLLAEAAIQSAEIVLPIFQKNDAPAFAIQAAKDCLTGKITSIECRADAAAAAAYAAAAYANAYADAYAAATYAAANAADAAAAAAYAAANAADDAAAAYADAAAYAADAADAADTYVADAKTKNSIWQVHINALDEALAVTE